MKTQHVVPGRHKRVTVVNSLIHSQQNLDQKHVEGNLEQKRFEGERSNTMKAISNRLLGALAVVLAILLATASVDAQNITNSGTWTNSGTVAVNNFTNQASGTATNTGTLQIRGTFTNNAADANFDTETGTVHYRALNTAQTVRHNIKNATYGGLQLRRGGTKTLSGNITVTGSIVLDDMTGTGTTLAVSTNTLTLTKTGTIFSFAGTEAVTSAATGTIDYAAAGNQDVIAIDYGHLTFSNSGTKSLAAGTTNVRGNFTLSGTAVADARTNNTTVDYSGSGAQSIAQIDYRNLSLSNAGTKTFASGTTKIDGNFTISGSATADARSNTTTIEFDGGAQNIAAINYNSLTLNGVGTKTFLSGTTRVNNAFTITAGTPDLTTNSTTFEYDGSGAQTVRDITYYNLFTSNTGTKTAAGNVTVNNNLDNGGTADDATTLDMSTFTLAVTGSKDNTNGTIQFGGAANGFAIASGTIEYNATGLTQTIGAGNYEKLTLTGGLGSFVKQTAVGGFSASGLVTVNSNARLNIDHNSFAGTGLGSGNSVSNAGYLFVNSGVTFAVTTDFDNSGTVDNTGTIELGAE